MKHILESLIANESYMTVPFASDPYDHVHSDATLKEIEAFNEELMNYSTVSNDLDAVKGILIEKLEQGTPLTNTAANITQVVLESISAKIRHNTYKVSVPEASCFYDKKTGLLATRISIENITDHIKHLATSLMEIIKKAWEKIKEFFSHIFSSNERAKNMLEHTKKIVEEVPDTFTAEVRYLSYKSVSTEDVEDNKKLISHQVPFGIKGRCDFESTSTIIQDTTKLIDSNRVIILNIIEGLEKVTLSELDIDLVQNVAEKLMHEVKSQLSNLPLNSKRISGNKVYYSYGHFIKGQHCLVVEHVGAQEEHLASRIFNLEVSLDESKDKELYNPMVLTKSEMKGLIDLTLRLNERAKQLNKVIPIIDKVLKTNFDRLYNFKNKDDREWDLKVTIHLVRDLFRYINGNLPRISGDATRTAMEVDRYIKTCISTYVSKE